jgi:GNAT superfamily N-acetyltransferase
LRNSLDAIAIGVHAGGVEVRLHQSVNEFRAIAEPLYRRDPVAHTIELTLLAAAEFPDNAFLMTVSIDGMAAGAALQTPPYPLACNGIPRALMESVITELAILRPDLDGVRGVRSTALAFAHTWCHITGRIGTISTEERLYRLATLRPPSGVAGTPRDAGESDRRLLVEWAELFFVETFSHNRDDAASERFVDNANRAGHRFVLWDIDGTPASMAMLRVPAYGVSRIGPVFTPRDRRGHGYGSAVTAAASDLARGNGTPDVVLFADLANPVSNAIYQRIGFEPVVDSVRIDFVTVD